MKLNSDMLHVAAFATNYQTTPKATKLVAKLKKAAQLHPCGVCSKPIGNGYRHDGMALGLCEPCYDEAGLENMHSDEGHEEAFATCSICR